MIYDDRPLAQEEVKTSKWEGRWDPQALCKGTGILMEGVFHKTTKHTIQDSTATKRRFIVFHIEFSAGCLRRYDTQSQEIEANFGQTALVRTGYLHSSYKQETKVTADTVDYQKVVDLLNSRLSPLVRPTHAGELCLWAEEDAYNHVEIEYGQHIRLKTRGNSPLIDSLTKLDTVQKSRSSNFAGGEQTGGSWTSKVMGVKQTQDVPVSLPQDEVEGVGDEEWDD